MNHFSDNGADVPSRGVVKRRLFIPLAAKLSAVTGLLVAAGVLVTGALFARGEWRVLLRRWAGQAQTLAVACASSLDVVDQYAAISSPAPRETDSWQRTHRELLALRERAGNFAHLTTLIPVGRRHAQVVVSTHERLEPGMLVKLPAGARTLFGEKGEVLRASGVSAALHSNGLMESVSASVPLRAPSGKIGALLTVDVPVEEINAHFASRRETILIAAVLAGVAALLLAGLIAIALTAPATELIAFARHVTRGDLEHEITERSRDELGLLAASLERMRLALREIIRAAKNHRGPPKP